MKNPMENIPLAFQEVYQKNYNSIVRQLRYIINDATLAEDITQEAFLKLYNSPPPDATGIKSWLLKVAINISYNYKRSEQRREKRESLFYQGDTKLPENCEDRVLVNLEIQLTSQALQVLSIKDRSCLILRYSGYSYQEIADILSINKASVGTTIARAQAKFKEIYFRLAEGGNRNVL